ncbi:MAG TPA: C25 family cysteine peptidase [Pyrinomonadaceae bacterium]
MKKIISTIIITILCFSSVLSVPAQKNSGLTASSPISRGAKLFDSVAAFTDENGVWLEWQTGIENEILGFHAYRVENGEKQLVSPVLIPANLSPRGDKTTQGRNYNYFDPQGTSRAAYVIESIDLNGYKQTSREFYPQVVSDLSARAGVASQELQKRSAASNPSLQKDDLSLPSELKSEAQTNNFVPGDAQSTQKWVAAQTGAKIAVKQDGLYRVARAELQAGGFNVNAATNLWQLYADGIEQGINVGANGDYIEFYGRGVDSLESDARIYYLVVGTEPGRRMGTTFIRGIAAKVVAPNFDQLAVKKERLTYLSPILNGDAENFFGAFVSSGSPGITTVNLSDLDSASVQTVTVSITVQGYTFTPHQYKVQLNETEIGTLNGSNRDLLSANFSVPSSLLVEGTNTIKISALTNSVGFTETVKISYPRRYQAIQERLSFYTQNYRTTKVQRFNTPDIRVFDLSDPTRPSLVTDLQISQQGLTYQVTLPSARSRVFYAVAGGGLLTAASITPNVPSTLSTVAHSANLIIISYKDWMTQAENWANYRRAPGMTVEVVNVEDVFDEFDFGQPTPEAIRGFLSYAKTNWQTPPSYVLLLGDASYDARNFFNQGYNNFIPAQMVDTTFSTTGSDDALADFNDDGLAEIAVGRIPARDPATVTTLLNKTAAFEQGLATAQSRGALCASDLPDGFDFAGMCVRVLQPLPPGIPKMFVNRGDADARATLMNSINSGKYIVNYSGHGTFGAWAGNFFSRTDVPLMTNTNTNQTIFTLLTCLNGYYVDAFSDGLAEVLVKKSEGGAVVAWASSGETTPDVQEIMATRFFQQIGNNSALPRIGDLANDAKTVIGGGRDVRLSWVLLGDPTMKVKP